MIRRLQNTITLLMAIIGLVVAACSQSGAPLPRTQMISSQPISAAYQTGFVLYADQELHSDIALLTINPYEEMLIALGLANGDIQIIDLITPSNDEEFHFQSGHQTSILDLYFASEERLVSVGRNDEGFELRRWNVTNGEEEDIGRWITDYPVPSPFDTQTNTDETVFYSIQDTTIYLEQQGEESQLTWPHEILATAVSNTAGKDALLAITDRTGVSLLSAQSKEIIVHYSHDQLLLSPHTTDNRYLLSFAPTFLIITQDRSLRILSTADK